MRQTLAFTKIDYPFMELDARVIACLGHGHQVVINLVTKQALTY